MNSVSPKSLLRLPGFRFHPTEEELVSFYLERKIEGSLNIPPRLIQDVRFYQYDPWVLFDKFADSDQQDYVYMFVPRDRKYPSGCRPNRVASSGYWKATGTDKKIMSRNGTKCVGLKKTLVYYKGKAPNGVKTGWIMNEYRLPRTDSVNHSVPKDLDVTLCRLYRKNSVASAVSGGSRAVNNVEPLPAAPVLPVRSNKSTRSCREKTPALSSTSSGVTGDSLDPIKTWLEDGEVESYFNELNSSLFAGGGLFTPTGLESHLKSQGLLSSATESPWL